jgi:hypothetical protein
MAYEEEQAQETGEQKLSLYSALYLSTMHRLTQKRRAILRE